MKTAFKLGSLGGHFLPTFIVHTHWGTAAVIDLNGDGFDDFIQTGSYYPDEPYPATARPGFVLFAGATGFIPATDLQVSRSTLLNVHAREFAFADFNEDSVLDFFIADHGYDATPFPGQQNVLYLSSRTGTNINWQNATANLPQLADFTHSVTVGDVNRDGHVDIFAGNGSLDSAYFLLGNGKGNFTKSQSILPTNSGGALFGKNVAVYASLLHDFDLDGWTDLVLGTGSASSSHQMFWSNAGSFAGSAGSALPSPQNFGTAWSIMDVQPLDMNYDGLPDLVVAYLADVLQGGWLLQVLINQGNRSFVDETPKYITNPGVRSGGDPAKGGEPAWIEFLVPRDVNHDGRMDFVVESKPWGKPLPDAYPIILLHQADGRFDPLTVSDLRAAGSPGYMLDYGVHYAERGPNQDALFIQMLRQADGSIGTNEQTVSFEVAASQWIGGTALADTLKGTPKADEFGGFGGSDAIDGGSGVDSARYNAKRADATIQKTATGWTVASAQDGSDTLTNIERLQFSDSRLALDMDGNAGSVAKILGAVFGKQYLGNKVFVGSGLALLDSGMRYQDVVALAVRTDIFAQLAGSHSNGDFINHIFKNVVGNLPTQAEFDYFVNLLNSGGQSQASLALLACETALNVQHIDLVGLANTGIEFTQAI